MIDMNLSPIRHPNSDKHYRVPVHIYNGGHTIFVGDNHRRRFDVDTLPDVLKHKLSMINSSPYGERLYKHDPTNIDVYIMPATMYMKDEFSMIGWRATEEMYCVVLTEKELDELRGEMR